jgi:hypothetical protein
MAYFDGYTHQYQVIVSQRLEVPETMEIPPEWLAEAGLNNFVATSSGFKCSAPHVLIPLADIERVVRDRPLDANGFCHDRMIRVLVGVRDGADILPPVPVECIELNQRRMHRLRDGTHRFYASLTLGFSHLPCEICEPV